MIQQLRCKTWHMGQLSSAIFSAAPHDGSCSYHVIVQINAKTFVRSINGNARVRWLSGETSEYLPMYAEGGCILWTHFQDTKIKLLVGSLVPRPIPRVRAKRQGPV